MPIQQQTNAWEYVLLIGGLRIARKFACLSALVVNGLTIFQNIVLVDAPPNLSSLDLPQQISASRNVQQHLISMVILLHKHVSQLAVQYLANFGILTLSVVLVYSFLGIRKSILVELST